MAEYTRKKSKITYRNPASLIPYDKNARTHDSELEFLCNSIRENGFDAGHAIVVDKDDVIICGHGRRMAAMKLGMKEVPVLKRDDLTDDQVKAYRLSDNKLSDLSGWDFDVLDKELNLLREVGFDMTQFGFDDFSDFDVPLAEGDDESEDEGEDGTVIMEAPSTEKGGPVKVYRIIVDCEDLNSQKALYDELQDRGFDCLLST